MEFLHKKLVISESVFGPGAYGDSYTIAGEDKEFLRPLVVYIGGSISDKIYEARRETAPTAVAREFLAAAGDTPAADLLICPFPAPSRTPSGDGVEPGKRPDGVLLLTEGSWQSVLRMRFLVHLVSELLRARGAPLPSAIAFLGFSAGAYLAFGLALDLPKAKGAAVFGGTSMSEAVAQSHPDSFRGKQFLALAGDDDPLAPNASECSSLLCRLGGQAETRLVQAGHSFQEYAGCGAVRECFAFTLGLLLK